MYLLSQLLCTFLEWVEAQVQIVKRDVSALVESLVLFLLSLALAVIGIGFLLAGAFLLMQPHTGAPVASFILAGVVLCAAIIVGSLAKKKSTRR